MSKRKPTADLGVGEDSFLDTTANLVGILIILVVVIGAKTKIDAEAYGRKLAETPTSSAEEPRREALALIQSLNQQKIEMRNYELETEYRKRERDALLRQVAEARQQIDAELESVDDEQRALVESSSKLESLKSQLSDVQQQIGAAEPQPQPPVVLEHLPTPMARTVFTREMHVQLSNGLVTVIPWDRLVATLRDQAPLAARRGSSRGRFEDVLGPIGGYLMRYRMNAVPGGFELDRFELETTSDAPSEPLAEALSGSGRLRIELASRQPGETVVTVWVAPDSFEEFRQLKAALFDEGFLSAARPLPDGVRIGASPNGTRSSAQ